VRLQVERFAALREAVGDDVDIAIEFHGRVSPAVAKVLIVDGHVVAPTAPGLGIELLPEEERAEEDFDGGWTLPTWRTADGAVAPW
jgi:galactonate dehydratase